MKNCATRDKISAFVADNPSATVREIQAACKISSTSVVAHHMKTIARAAHPCPICKGSGHLPLPISTHRNKTKDAHSMAKVLRANGYSIRQIQSFLGWKSPQSVVGALESKHK